MLEHYTPHAQMLPTSDHHRATITAAATTAHSKSQLGKATVETPSPHLSGKTTVEIWAVERAGILGVYCFVKSTTTFNPEGLKCGRLIYCVASMLQYVSQLIEPSAISIN